MYDVILWHGSRPEVHGFATRADAEAFAEEYRRAGAAVEVGFDAGEYPDAPAYSEAEIEDMAAVFG